MCRLDWESASWKMYVPGSKTVPGTSSESFSVTMVFLFHGSACATGTAATQTSALHTTNTSAFIARIFLPPLMVLSAGVGRADQTHSQAGWAGNSNGQGQSSDNLSLLTLRRFTYSVGCNALPLLHCPSSVPSFLCVGACPDPVGVTLWQIFLRSHLRS